MKKSVIIVLSILLAFLILAQTMSITVFAVKSEESISIKTVQDLIDVRNKLDGSYYLENDIDLSDYDNWTPIGTKESPFTGKFDGGNYKVKNLRITDIGENEYAGLFGYADGAEISGIKIDGEINVISDKASVGSVCGLAEKSRFNKCRNNADIILKSDDSGESLIAGGIVGSLKYGYIEQCTNTGNISTDFSFNAKKSYSDIISISGGIVGYASGQIQDCRNAGIIKAADDCDYSVAGGTAGLFFGNTGLGNPSNIYVGYVFIHNVLNTGTVIGFSSQFGNPVVGYIDVIDWAVFDENEPDLFNGCYYVKSINADSDYWDRGIKSIDKDDLSKTDAFPEYDFKNVWEINEDSGSPTLRYESADTNTEKEKSFSERMAVFFEKTRAWLIDSIINPLIVFFNWILGKN